MASYREFLPKWSAKVRAHFRVAQSCLTWERAKAGVRTAAGAWSKVIWIGLGTLVLIVVVHGAFGEDLRIEPISVPKSFAENGYTAEVASQHLRDALIRFARNTGSRMQGPSLNLSSELPKITVPKVDISSDTISSILRNLLHYGNGHDISGEFFQHGELLWLRLRIDGEEVFANMDGVAPSSSDELFDTAAPAVIGVIRPYLAASALYDMSPERALQMAEDLITRLPESNTNVHWAFILKARYLADHNDPVQAERFLRKAISLNSSNAAAHYNLGVLLENQHKIDAAINEYRLAIKIDPSYALAHNNLGVALTHKGAANDAIAEYRRAIAFDPGYAAAHRNLAAVLKDQKKTTEAVNEYHRALEIDPRSALAHTNLANILRDQGRPDEAVAEYRTALDVDPKYASAHANLGNLLQQQGKTDEALREYNLALAGDPNNGIAQVGIKRINLERVERSPPSSGDGSPK